MAASVAFPFAHAARTQFDFHAPTFTQFDRARALSAALNALRDLETAPNRAVRAGELAAAALLDEVFGHIIALYVSEVEPDALEKAPAFLDANLDELEIQTLFERVQTDFSPPQPLEKRPETLEYLLRLHLANRNPALDNFSEVFDDAPLRPTIYGESLRVLRLYFETLPPFGPQNQNLFDLLLAPILEHPDSIEDQLKFILGRWESLIEPFLGRLLTHLDLIREENKPTFFGPGPAKVLDFRSGAGAVGMEEYEAFTPDRDWMPSVVLLAKQTYVWLDQLSKKYGAPIKQLDQVPDAELDEMASRGITGLWLIGVCQRSNASQTIKRMTGNPDAIASAYSLYSYDIAWELGGESALENLKSRAGARGIRMASDMVPNHMAIDSQWVIEHPDWFLSLPTPPFPMSSFDGPDLSQDSRVGIFLENGYYSRTDASVVFRRLDRQTNENRYVYHGNDGTAIPWNDTAQLDYLKPEVREAVMQTILHVARQFPIIRFDAAMTLAKRHIHRLWFPAPGSGGDIPSRAGRGVSNEEFERLMPQEFWREVVERVGREVPDTLLLAEAFWMMEGFFVRTLGMHRVYNSAFMNMLRDEKNAEYRQTLKNTLEFDPDILGRFVNFMNNPDEKTAVEQFGKGDKYFGVATLLSTLPGLPMFGHGQIEGYAEKYGMEYPRAYWNEVPDLGFIEHHKSAIFPLLHKRYLFAGSDNFTLYPFWNGDGYINEDVFAYSNRAGNERALVVFNNRDSSVSGWIKTSDAFAQKAADGSKTVAQRELGESLGLSNGPRRFAIFRDNSSGLEFLRLSSELTQHGLFIELGPYGHQVFLDWREVEDSSGLYTKLAAMLGGRGVPNVERAVKEMLLEPVLTPFRALCDPLLWEQLMHGEAPPENQPSQPEMELSQSESGLSQSENNLSLPESGLSQSQNNLSLPQTGQELPRTGQELPESGLSQSQSNVAQFRTGQELSEMQLPNLAPLPSLDELETRFAAFVSAARIFLESETAGDEIVQTTRQNVEIALESGLETSEKALLLAYALVGQLGALCRGLAVDKGLSIGEGSARIVEEWLLGELIGEALLPFGATAGAGATLKIWLRHLQSEATPFSFLSRLLGDDDARRILGINTFERVIYFRGEGWDALRDSLELGASFEDLDLPLEALDAAAKASEFRVVKWMELARRG